NTPFIVGENFYYFSVYYKGSISGGILHFTCYSLARKLSKERSALVSMMEMKLLFRYLYNNLANIILATSR
ncbi:hypothetical protein, partial [Oceanobacillus jeddahense]|uniref:hypothetical protein n=1 Tax=Oceanobacillus jeddahense TaxID=1462527 RepID=UPI00362AF758